MKPKTAVGSATVLALSCAAVPTMAAECQTNVYISSYFSGGPNANCTIADKTILGISQNEIADNADILNNDIFDTPADDPGIEFQFTTLSSSVDGASFVFSVTAPSSSSIDGVSLSVEQIPSGSATLTASLSNSLALSASLGESQHRIFPRPAASSLPSRKFRRGGMIRTPLTSTSGSRRGLLSPNHRQRRWSGSVLRWGVLRGRKRRASASKTG